jgi:branched-chain amino acid transport system ATP-binding protein
VLIAIGARRGVHIWQILGKKPPQMVGEAYSYLQQVGLDTHAESSAASLAHGDKRKLEFAMLLALEPTVLLLDEPTAGMSLAETKAIFDMIARLKASRKYTMILVEHKLDVVMKLSDRIAVLHQGELITEGEPAQVMSNPEVTQAYLGGHNGNTA